MKSSVNFSETYLYKIRLLANTLDKVFDNVLRAQADITLSQFMVLLAISRHEGINQRQVARYLGISAVAVKRQVDIAKQSGWVVAVNQDTPGDRLQLTDMSHEVIEAGLRALEQHVFQIFDGHNHNANLMQHIDLLLSGAKEVLNKKS